MKAFLMPLFVVIPFGWVWWAKDKGVADTPKILKKERMTSESSVAIQGTINWVAFYIVTTSRLTIASSPTLRKAKIP